jgi:hypothetical protein
LQEIETQARTIFKQNWEFCGYGLHLFRFLAGACWKQGIKQALLDVRAVHPGPTPVFSPADLVTLVNTFFERVK